MNRIVIIGLIAGTSVIGSTLFISSIMRDNQNYGFCGYIGIELIGFSIGFITARIMYLQRNLGACLCESYAFSIIKFLKQIGLIRSRMFILLADIFELICTNF